MIIQFCCWHSSCSILICSQLSFAYGCNSCLFRLLFQHLLHWGIMFLFLKSLYWIFHLFICFYVHFFRVKYHKSPSLTLCNKHHVFPDFFLSEHNEYLFPLIFPVSLLLIFVLRVAWDKNNVFFDFQIPFPGMCWDQPSLTDGIKNVKSIHSLR